MKNNIFYVLTLLVFVVPVLAQVEITNEENGETQEKKVGGAPANKKQSMIHFRFSDDELVQGAAPNPEVDYINQKDEKNIKKLIRLRDNFIPEAQRGRGEFSADE